MYALYKKCKAGYPVNVKIIAYSEDKSKLMALLPYEVERYLRKNMPKMLPHELDMMMPNSYRPTDYWSEGPFDATEFEVCEVPGVQQAGDECYRDLERLRRENEDYLISIGIDK